MFCPTRRWRWAGLIALAGCGSAATGPRLAMDHLPAELHGLVAGVSTEQDVMAAWPGAVVKRDQTLGGETRVALNEQPAIKITVEGRVSVAYGLWFALHVLDGVDPTNTEKESHAGDSFENYWTPKDENG